MIESITTGKTEWDMEQIDLFAKVISSQQNSEFDQVKANLLELRLQYFQQLEKYNYERNKGVAAVAGSVVMSVLMVLNKTFWGTRKGFAAFSDVAVHNNVGAITTAARNLWGPLVWTAAGLIYIAETGMNYRKYKKGLITKREFKKRMVFGAFGKLAMIGGTAIGSMAGFAIGTAVFPGIGTITGVVIGGIAGSLIVRAITLKTLAKIDDRL